MAPTISHSDGVPVVLDTPVNGKHGAAASSVRARALPDEYFHARLSTLARNRTHDGIRAVLHLENRPGVLSLLAGKPNASTFPITALQFTVRDPADPARDEHVALTDDELRRGLQYGPTPGAPPFIEWAYGLQRVAQGRERGEGWALAVGNGSQDLIYKAVTALVNPGDAVMMEVPVYAGVPPMFQTIGCEVHEIETDDKGIDSGSLRRLLESWPAGKPKPKVLYTVPFGCNPTGMTATLERRLEVLELSREHDFFIFEDDPYHFLYYGAAPRPPSYFALEKDQPEIGRVIRFDSLSKVLSSGLRLGFASGPEVIIKAMNDHSTVANLQPNSLAQILAVAVLGRWGYDGFLKHTERVSEFYRQKRDVFEAAMRRHLDGLAEWVSPEAGMFLWFKLLAGGEQEGDSDAVIRTTALEHGVLALPGTVFYPGKRKSAYVRASFSVLDDAQTDEALRRLRGAILESRK